MHHCKTCCIVRAIIKIHESENFKKENSFMFQILKPNVLQQYVYVCSFFQLSNIYKIPITQTYSE